MAGWLISDEEKQKIRDSVDLVALMGERSPMKQKGKDFWCCCPVHNEKTPSCKVDPVTQLWHCFGCHEGGDVFTYLMKVDGYSFNEAVQYLADRAHIQLERNAKSPGPSTGEKQRLKMVCKETAAFYHMQLMRSQDSRAAHAREYLSSRNLGGSIPKEWNLGYAPGGGSLVRHLSSKGFNSKEMIAANVAVSGKDGRTHDRFYERVMFPICDVAGDVIAFGGRIIGDGQPKYLNTNETPLFHKSNVLYGLHKAKAAMASTGKAIVCEGYTDVIALHQAGITNCVATLGTALTKQHIRLLSRHAKNGIIYLFDGDAAGQHAADRALQFIDAAMTPEAGASQIDLSAVTLPDNLDPADFVSERGASALNALLQQAKPLLEYGIERRLENVDLTHAEGRALGFSRAIEVLAPIKDSLLAKDYAVQIAGMCRMREEDALAALSKLKVPAQRTRDDASDLRKAATNDAFDAYGGVSQTQNSMVQNYMVQNSQQYSSQSSSSRQSQSRLSQPEQSRRKFEKDFLCLCAQHPHIGIANANTLACTNWHEKINELLASSILDTLSKNANAKPAEIISNAAESIPQAGGLLTSSYSSQKTKPEALAKYLVEELALGDLESSIDELRVHLKNPGALSEEEYDMYFESIASMQKDLVARRKKHVLPN